MTFFVIDTEADGPAAGLYSMVSFGAVVVDDDLKTTFSGKVRPITDRWDPESLAISGISREEHCSYEDPAVVMPRFAAWVLKHCKGTKPVFVSDNPAFDWQNMNYYLHAFADGNPFGHSARRIGDIYAGLIQDLEASSMWRDFIRTKANHDPLVDAIGNAEGFRTILEQYDLSRKSTSRRRKSILAAAQQAGFVINNPRATPPEPEARRLVQFAALIRHMVLSEITIPVAASITAPPA